MPKNAAAAGFVLAAGSTLSLARRGLTDYIVAEDRWYDGIYSAVTAGRNVTFVLQKIRGIDPDFDKWYNPHAQRLARDADAIFLKMLRNKIEKEGELFNPTSASGFIEYMEVNSSDAPPGSNGFIIDGAGRLGWRMPQPDGGEEIVYRRPPNTRARYELGYAGMPDGRYLSDMIEHHFQLLDEIVESARQRYC